MRVAMRDDSYVPFLQFDRLESGIADERYPARTAGDDMILDRMLGAGRYLVSNLRARRRYANAELSEYIADRIRRRVKDPKVAEILIPKDHGFGVQRLPLETKYFEAYNRNNVHLVDISETPLVRITEACVPPSTTMNSTSSSTPLDSMPLPAPMI